MKYFHSLRIKIKSGIVVASIILEAEIIFGYTLRFVMRLFGSHNFTYGTRGRGDATRCTYLIIRLCVYSCIMPHSHARDCMRFIRLAVVTSVVSWFIRLSPQCGTAYIYHRIQTAFKGGHQDKLFLVNNRPSGYYRARRVWVVNKERTRHFTESKCDIFVKHISLRGEKWLVIKNCILSRFIFVLL